MHTDRHSVLRERKLSVQVNEQKGMRGGSRARHGMPRPEARGRGTIVRQMKPLNQWTCTVWKARAVAHLGPV